MEQGKIVVLGTGGTIAGTASNTYDSSRYVAAQHGIDHLLQGLPLGELPHREVVSEQVAQIDSKDMDVVVWIRLLERCLYWLGQPDVRGLVITHGTDTLEETAYFLHALLPAKVPVVLTCAMRPANALQADGPQNLLDALVLAQHAQARGVIVVCAGTIHGAQEVEKAHAWRLDAFSSGDEGALGHVVQGNVRQHREWPVSGQLGHAELLARLRQASAWPRVEIITSHGGATGALVDALLAAGGPTPLRGLVVAGTGGGTVHEALNHALERASACGVRVLRASRSCRGGGPSSPEQRWPLAEGLSPAKARIALMLELLGEKH